MKRIICLITVLCIVLGSFSFAFAQDWSASDSQNLSNVAGRLYYNNQSAAYYLYNIATNTNNIYNKTVDIYNALFNNGHNITYWVQAISTWMSPIYNSITSIPTDLFIIQGLLGYPTVDSNTGVTTWNPYLKTIADGITTYISSHPTWNGNGWTISAAYGNFYQSVVTGFNSLIEMKAYEDTYYLPQFLNGYNSVQTPLNWTNLQYGSMTPTSGFDGVYKWLSNIQLPVARLSYVLASDERIEAQEAAAANEEAVVDNFIDSTGNGSASPSDIGSISDLSSGYKSNFGSDATVTGIFNIFNSNNMGWFSQETANQLDTTSSTRRGSSFETPLLDQQINNIYDQIGVKHD